MHTLVVECAASDTEALTADLWSFGSFGILQEEIPGGRSSLRASFEFAVDLGRLAERYPAASFDWKHPPGRDWAGVSLEGWEPLLVGERFFLVPEWRRDPAPPGRIRLEVRPGNSFGTGYAPATQLCLIAIERHLRPGDAFLDVGSGTGILSAAAGLSGAGRILACDIDPEACRETRSNLRRNGIAAAVFAGSARAVRSQCVDFAACNINARSVESLAAELARVLKPGGVLVTGGYRGHQKACVEEALEFNGLPVRAVLERKGWLCLIS